MGRVGPPGARRSVSRGLAALAAAAIVLGLGACSGVRSVGSSSSAAASTSAQQPAPAPSGPGCAADAGTPDQLSKMSDLMVSEALAKFPGTKQFAAYLSQNDSLGTALDKAKNFAIFVPNDAAFAKLTPEQLAALNTNATVRDSMITYAVSAEPIDPTKVKDAQQVHTIYSDTAELTVTQSDNGLQLNGTSTVVCGAITTARASIFITDTVLFPPS